jgi:hypothetical protein
MNKCITFNAYWSDDSSLVEELKYLRAAFAQIYQRHAPRWQGKSYATRAEYPAVADDWDSQGFTEGNNSRTAVFTCDWILTVLTATRSSRQYTISKRQLAQLMRQYATIHQIAMWDHTRPTFMAGYEQLVVRPSAMRAGKAKISKRKKKENYEAAIAALKWAKTKYPIATADNKISRLKVKAAEHLGVHVSTVHRWLRGSK